MSILLLRLTCTLIAWLSPPLTLILLRLLVALLRMVRATLLQPLSLPHGPVALLLAVMLPHLLAATVSALLSQHPYLISYPHQPPHLRHPEIRNDQ